MTQAASRLNQAPGMNCTIWSIASSAAAISAA